MDQANQQIKEFVDKIKNFQQRPKIDNRYKEEEKERKEL